MALVGLHGSGHDLGLCFGLLPEGGSVGALEFHLVFHFRALLVLHSLLHSKFL